MNKVVITGRLTKKPELKELKESKLCEFTLAVNRDKEKTDFINCIVWNKQAENLVKYQDKGSLIAIFGEIRVDAYEIEGNKRYKTYVLVNNIEFLGIKKEIPTEKLTTKTEVQEQFKYSDEDLPW